MHIFQCDNFCSFVNELSEGKDMTALNKKWLSGLVAGALMASLSVRSRLNKKHSTFITGLIYRPGHGGQF